MCYSAKVLQEIRKYERRFGVRLDYLQFEILFRRRRKDASIRIAKAFEANFDEPRNAQERRLKELIAEHRNRTAAAWEQELFAQKKRLADAQRKLKAKATKAARNDERIAANKIRALSNRLADLRRIEPKPEDSRIFPMHFAPIVIHEGGENRLVLARYHCRPAGQPAAIDRKFPGLYNARRDNLEKFWRHEFGRSHALFVIDSFYENVDRDGRNAVLQFVPKPPRDMLVAALYARSGQPGADDELWSFAAITDAPPPEVAAAGHDRCPVNLKEANGEAWLTPERRSLPELQAILDDVERPYYRHEVLAA